MGWLRELGENSEPKRSNLINKHTPSGLQILPEAYQDDSNKVENDESQREVQGSTGSTGEGINFGCVVGHGPLEEMKLNQVFKWLDSNDAYMFSIQYQYKG